LDSLLSPKKSDGSIDESRSPTPDQATSLSSRIGSLNSILSEYRKIYTTIGPEGLKEDDIVIIEEEYTENDIKKINLK
jgi:hypothetical protein